jgi:hypothetical protein
VYIEELSHEERGAFMKLARLVLYADGIIAKEEVEFFEHLKLVTGQPRRSRDSVHLTQVEGRRDAAVDGHGVR